MFNKNDRLDSWKEIAQYLDRTVRTCQRWENKLDLPVYRVAGKMRSSVYAFRSEIDFWMKQLHKKIKKPSFSLAGLKILMISLILLHIILIFFLILRVSFVKEIFTAILKSLIVIILYLFF